MSQEYGTPRMCVTKSPDCETRQCLNCKWQLKQETTCKCSPPVTCTCNSHTQKRGRKHLSPVTCTCMFVCASNGHTHIEELCALLKERTTLSVLLWMKNCTRSGSLSGNFKSLFLWRNKPNSPVFAQTQVHSTCFCSERPFLVDKGVFQKNFHKGHPYCQICTLLHSCSLWASQRSKVLLSKSALNQPSALPQKMLTASNVRRSDTNMKRERAGRGPARREQAH